MLGYFVYNYQKRVWMSIYKKLQADSTHYDFNVMLNMPLW